MGEILVLEYNFARTCTRTREVVTRTRTRTLLVLKKVRTCRPLCRNNFYISLHLSYIPGKTFLLILSSQIASNGLIINVEIN